MLGGIYNTGTISLTNGSDVATGTGTFWGSTIVEGDLLLVPGGPAYIQDVTDDTHIDLGADWLGSNLSNVRYIIVKQSALRYAPNMVAGAIQALLETLGTPAVLYNVEGDAPDPSLGEDGQRALKSNSGQWKLWLKTG